MAPVDDVRVRSKRGKMPVWWKGGGPRICAYVNSAVMILWYCGVLVPLDQHVCVLENGVSWRCRLRSGVGPIRGGDGLDHRCRSISRTWVWGLQGTFLNFFHFTSKRSEDMLWYLCAVLDPDDFIKF